jgi:ABC-type phosphate/phosphonate transport system substrate-binding protein
VRNGLTSYKKILLGSLLIGAAASDYEIITFAMTTMGPDGSTETIKELVAKELVSVQQLNIISVPKDLDAILALALGQVKMALVAQDNLQVISDANPRIIRTIKTFNRSITVPMPVLCYLEGRAESDDVEKLVEAFKKMTSEHPRNKIMEMLQIDDWQKFTQ